MFHQLHLPQHATRHSTPHAWHHRNGTINCTLADNFIVRNLRGVKRFLLTWSHRTLMAWSTVLTLNWNLWAKNETLSASRALQTPFSFPIQKHSWGQTERSNSMVQMFLLHPNFWNKQSKRPKEESRRIKTLLNHQHERSGLRSWSSSCNWRLGCAKAGLIHAAQFWFTVFERHMSWNKILFIVPTSNPGCYEACPSCGRHDLLRCMVTIVWQYALHVFSSKLSCLFLLPRHRPMGTAARPRLLKTESAPDEGFGTRRFRRSQITPAWTPDSGRIRKKS